MNLLVISYSYIPATSPRAFRWGAIAECWAKKGHRVDVVCSRFGGASAREVINGVNIFRAFDPLGRTRTGASINRAQGDSVVYGGGSLLKLVGMRSLRMLYSLTWKNIYWPDYACLWIVPAYRLAKKLARESRYDAVITVSHPFSSHVVGLALRKRCKATNWIMDVGDPFAFMEEPRPNNRTLYRRLNDKIEGQALEEADVVTVTTQETLEEYIWYFNNSVKKKIRTIPPLVSVPVTASCEKRNDHVCNPERVPARLVFAGTLYKTIRNPTVLLNVLSMLAERDSETEKSFEMHFVGDLNDCENLFAPYRSAIDRWLFMHGPMDRADATVFVERADVLVNLGNRTSYQLPSKVLEYVATGKRILNVALSGRDSTMRFLQHYPCVFNITPSTVIDAKFIDALDRFVKTRKSVCKRDVEHFLWPYNRSVIADKYLSLCRSSLLAVNMRDGVCSAFRDT